MKGREWNRASAEPSDSSSSARGEDGGSGEDVGVSRGGDEAICAADSRVLWTRSPSIIGVIDKVARGGGDGVRGKTRLRRDGETTRERRAEGWCCVSAAGWVQIFGSAEREELKRGCALRARSAAATSSRVEEGFAWLGGRGLLYLERGAAREDWKARKKVS